MTPNAYDLAARTLADAPLSPGALAVARRPAGASVPAAAAGAVEARFIGSPSTLLALAVADDQALVGEAGDRLGLADLVRPILAAAADRLGPGTLSDATVADASDLFGDPDAAVYTVTDEAGAEVAWFAARVLVAPAGSRTGTAEAAGRLGRISDVEMALTVQIGRTRMAVRDVLAIEPGAVIELDRAAGSPADILLNGRLIAHGEIVVVDQDYAVRVTHILDSADDAA